jgi:Porin subfamily
MSHGSHFRIGPVCCVSSLLFLAFAPSSFALGTCAAYGPDFALVEGTHTCVRIGGHVRVQFSPSAEADPFETSSLHANATSAALRSESLDNDSGLRHMRVDTNDESYR